MHLSAECLGHPQNLEEHHEPVSSASSRRLSINYFVALLFGTLSQTRVVLVVSLRWISRSLLTPRADLGVLVG